MIDSKLLLKKYRDGQCTPEEIDLLHSWFHELNISDNTSLTEEDLKDALIPAVSSNEDGISGKQYWKKLALTAAIVVLISLSALLVFQYNNNTSGEVFPADAVVLTLEDGKKINLKDVEKETFDEKLGFSIVKTASGRIQYNFDVQNKPSTHKVAYHTLQTPIGEVFEIILSDGSTVVLNAQSTLRFPTSFLGLEARQMELVGEAFFDVNKEYIDSTKTSRKPFIIKSKDQYVEVLGTAFNIHAYPNESLFKTTLAHGKVRVFSQNRNNQMVISASGDQVILQNNQLQKGKVKLENELAWKSGKIVFEDQDIYSIMRSIARYYPIEVEYLADFKGANFGGVISKDKSLEDILKLVEETGEIKFEVSQITNIKSERRVKVMK
ncbi:FecR family protein [Sphingobacterium bovistauri]|uniref:DUF4974 domain-containing protein n=1 Tax=Sphingobacterium bovistauri TaxID=2781959 RepID=A0ABS7Z6V0_9SPHI|nr:FecR family protein [Sphingobacterium bovistauri]MCA5005872.1 DUF4974 domain-containing protein [Sphingobacterium bovistauri]